MAFPEVPDSSRMGVGSLDLVAARGWSRCL